MSGRHPRRNEDGTSTTCGGQWDENCYLCNPRDVPSEPETTPRIPEPSPTLPSLRGEDLRDRLHDVVVEEVQAKPEHPKWMDVFIKAKADHPSAAVWAPAIGVTEPVSEFILSIGRRTPEETSDGIIVFISTGGRRFMLHLTEIPGGES